MSFVSWEFVVFFAVVLVGLRVMPTRTGRQLLLHNNDVIMSVAMPTEPMNYHYRNGQGDELIFVDQGEGRIESLFGTLPFRRGDYLVIPIGTTWRMATNGPAKLLVFECRGNIETPRRYRNEHGQMLEHSPYCERDIRVPQELESHDEQGEFPVLVRARDRLTMHILDHHPLDAVGWDGFLYPWIFSIHDFEPRTGALHLPPPTHQTFEGRNFVLCSFVPRLYDYHPDAIPAPYVMMAATDARHFTRICDRVYRFAPFRMSKEQRASIHSYDEHLGVDEFVDGVRWYQRLIERLPEGPVTA